jgi:hypothetical protein
MICAKRSQFPATPGGTGPQGHWRRSNVRNKANRLLEGVGPGACPELAEGTPNPRGAEGRLCDIASMPRFGKQTRFLGVRACLEAEMRKTKPNLGKLGHLGDGVCGCVCCAKRSQSRDCGFPERHRATGVRPRRSCRIADCGLGTNLPPSAFLWAGCPNKPNSRRAECVLRA